MAALLQRSFDGVLSAGLVRGQQRVTVGLELEDEFLAGLEDQDLTLMGRSGRPYVLAWSQPRPHLVPARLKVLPRRIAVNPELPIGVPERLLGILAHLSVDSPPLAGRVHDPAKHLLLLSPVVREAVR